MSDQFVDQLRAGLAVEADHANADHGTTTSKVQLPHRVAEQLEAIRQSGETNMLARTVVQLIADRREFYELVVWIEHNPSDYAKAIFCGIEAVAVGEEAPR